MNAALTSHPLPRYRRTPLFPLGKDTTIDCKIIAEGVHTETILDKEVLVVSHEVMKALSEAAPTDINHLLRARHLTSLKSMVEDPEASDNDTPSTSSRTSMSPLPMCQDAGTAIIMGKKVASSGPRAGLSVDYAALVRATGYWRSSARRASWRRWRVEGAGT